jgi:hypothetical protein
MSINATSTPNETTPFDVFSSGFLGVALSTIITVIITVVITFVIQSYLNRPKIRGKIFNVISAEWSNPLLGIHKASFWVYVYLTNYHRNSISLVDYEFEIDFGNGYVKLERVYGDISTALPSIVTVKDDKGKDIQLKNLGSHLLYKNSRPVQYGQFIHGFVMFAGDLSLHHQKPLRVKFTCIDVFSNRHVICARKEEFINFNLLLELLDTASSPRGIYCP